jgi:hypothetical protein
MQVSYFLTLAMAVVALAAPTPGTGECRAVLCRAVPHLTNFSEDAKSVTITEGSLAGMFEWMATSKLSKFYKAIITSGLT